jgi:DNA-binding NarL/FixJ family response regulator
MLVDDHPIVRRGLRDILADAFAGAIVHEADTAREAIALAGSHRWDVMILDLSLPDGSGLDVLERVRQMKQRVPVLILSIHSAEQFARRAIAAGAAGYLTKDLAGEDLVRAVVRLLRGGKHFEPDVLERAAQDLHPDSVDRPHERLSHREYEILLRIGHGKTVSEVASELRLSVKTVSTYRARVLAKMNMRTNAELMYYVVREDLRVSSSM